MAINTFATLKTAGANWVERDDLTDRWAEFIALAEARINRELRVNRMISRATASIADGYSAVPTDFLAPRSMRDSDSKLLNFITAEQMADLKGADYSGDLTYYALVGTEFEYAPVPTSAETVSLTYYAKVPALSDDNTTNWLLTSHPDVYVHGMLLEAAIYLKDGAEAQAQKALFDEVLRSVRAADLQSNWAANLTPSVGVTAV